MFLWNAPPQKAKAISLGETVAYCNMSAPCIYMYVLLKIHACVVRANSCLTKKKPRGTDAQMPALRQAANGAALGIVPVSSA